MSGTKFIDLATYYFVLVQDTQLWNLSKFNFAGQLIVFQRGKAAISFEKSLLISVVVGVRYLHHLLPKALEYFPQKD